MIRGLILSALVAATTFSSSGATDPENSFQPPAGLEEGWFARIETSYGRLIVRLLPEQAPQSVAHFAALAEGKLEWADPVTGELLKERYYDGVRIFRSEAAQRFEAGDRHRSGRSAPLLFVGEERPGPINFSRGYLVGMTRAAGGRVSAVQFFVTVARQPFLNGAHPCFGELIEGKDVALRLTTVKTYNNGRPIEPLWIESVDIFSVGSPASLPAPVRYFPKPTKLKIRKEKQRQ